MYPKNEQESRCQSLTSGNKLLQNIGARGNFAKGGKPRKKTIRRENPSHSETGLHKEKIIPPPPLSKKDPS